MNRKKIIKNNTNQSSNAGDQAAPAQQRLFRSSECGCVFSSHTSVYLGWDTTDNSA